MTFVTCKKQNKYIVWVKAANRYIILEKPAFEVFERLTQKIQEKEILTSLEKKYGVPTNEAKQFIRDIKKRLDSLQKVPTQKNISRDNEKIVELTSNSNFKSFYYRIQNKNFLFHFSSKWMMDMIHPGIENFLIENYNQKLSEFHLINKEDFLYLVINKSELITWPISDSEYFKGSISLALLNQLYQKTDDDWMGTFHAAALSKNNKAVIISAASGKGKSTLAALLTASGLTLISDDLVPVLANSNELYCLPQAISVKPGAVNVLTEFYPELKSAKITHNSSTGKEVYYLTKNFEFAIETPCVSAIIFPEFNPDISFQFNRIDNISAFQIFIPEAWIAPNKKNVKAFFDWFFELPCYKLVYNDNQKAVEKITQLLK